MTAIERRRCPDCVGELSVVQLEGTDFVERVPAILCEHCDRTPAEDEPLLVPAEWD